MSENCVLTRCEELKAVRLFHKQIEIFGKAEALTSCDDVTIRMSILVDPHITPEFVVLSCRKSSGQACGDIVIPNVKFSGVFDFPVDSDTVAVITRDGKIKVKVEQPIPEPQFLKVSEGQKAGTEAIGYSLSSYEEATLDAINKLPPPNKPKNPDIRESVIVVESGYIYHGNILSQHFYVRVRTSQ